MCRLPQVQLFFFCFYHIRFYLRPEGAKRVGVGGDGPGILYKIVTIVTSVFLYLNIKIHTI
jgi:hypothetical protein